MIVKCPHCHSELEGDVALRDFVKCPWCQTTFILKQNHVIPDQIVIPTVQSAGRNPSESSFSQKEKIYRYLTDERPSRRHNLFSVCFIVVLLLSLAGGFAWKAKLLQKTNLPSLDFWKKPLTGSEAIESSSSSDDLAPEAAPQKKGGGKTGKSRKRKLSDAEIVFKAALDAMLGENGVDKDIVKAYQGFQKADEMNYELAKVALAHIAWTMTEDDKQAFQKAGVSSPARHIYTGYPSLATLPAWVSRSGVAKFEQGLYQMRMGDRERNLEGMYFIAQAAKEGVSIAQRFLDSTMSEDIRYGLDVAEATYTAHLVLVHNPQFIMYYQRECDIELKKEFLRSIGATED